MSREEVGMGDMVIVPGRRDMQPPRSEHKSGTVVEKGSRIDSSDRLHSGDSIFKQLRAATQESVGPKETIQKSAGLICTSLFCTVLKTLIQLAIAAACLALGIIYEKECPAQNWIPIYLLVTGAISLASFIVTLIWNFYTATRKTDELDLSNLEPSSGCCQCLMILRGIFNALSGFFMIGWFIAGNVWVYSLYGEYSTNKDDSNYCNETVYLFSFVLLTLTWSLVALSLVLACCVCCCAVCCTAVIASFSSARD